MLNYYFLFSCLGFMPAAENQICEPPAEVSTEENFYVTPVIYLDPEHIHMITPTRAVSAESETTTEPQVFTIRR